MGYIDSSGGITESAINEVQPSNSRGRFGVVQRVFPDEPFFTLLGLDVVV
jgi:hypothetical protein